MAGKGTSIVPYFGQMQAKNMDRVPAHITFNQHKAIIRWIEENKRGFYLDRNLLFTRLLWETGGRVNDICQLNRENIDFERKGLNLYIAKGKKTIFVSLSGDMLLELSLYLDKYKDRNPLIGITRQQGYNLIKQFGKKIGLQHLHPHMYRHGIAIHLLNKGVPLPVISARLGHANTHITMSMYMKITPDLQHLHMSEVEMR